MLQLPVTGLLKVPPMDRAPQLLPLATIPQLLSLPTVEALVTGQATALPRTAEEQLQPQVTWVLHPLLTCPQRQAMGLLLLPLTTALLLLDTARKLSLPTTVLPLSHRTTVVLLRPTVLRVLTPRDSRTMLLNRRPNKGRATTLRLHLLMALQLGVVMVLQARQAMALWAQRMPLDTRHPLQVQATV